MALASISAYVIRNEKLSLRLTLLEIEDVLLHEETIPEFLKQLTLEIKRDGCLHHPIIADSESHVVLDGVHRVAALRKLGCKYVPTCLVDYGNPSIKILSWYRTVKGTAAVDQMLSQIKHVGVDVEKVRRIDKNVIGVSPAVAGIKTLTSNFLVNFPFDDLKQAFDIIECIEKRLKTIGLHVKYETESDSQQHLDQGSVDAFLLTPRLTKQDIIATARSGGIFTYKASRHIIPARPMHLCVPLTLLKSRQALSKTNNEFRDMLQKKRLKHIPPGSVFEDRRYEEDLYVFEDKI